VANISFIRSDNGWIVFDPLTAKETASAALALVNDTLGLRPVVAVDAMHRQMFDQDGALLDRGPFGHVDVRATGRSPGPQSDRTPVLGRVPWTPHDAYVGRPPGATSTGSTRPDWVR
jgi:hypothetical protein